MNLLSSTHYYSLAEHLLAELQTSGSSSATTFFLTDGLGSVLGVFSDKAGNAALLSTQLFTPYGTHLVANGNSIGQYTTKGFTGQYSDAHEIAPARDFALVQFQDSGYTSMTTGKIIGRRCVFS